MVTALVVATLLAAIYFVLKPLFHEMCPVCEGRNTEHCRLIYPADRQSFVCHDCHMWFSKKNKK